MSRQPSRVRVWCVVLARLIVGGALATAGISSVLAPTADFLAAIHAYAALPVPAEPYLAAGLPWVEAVIGLAIILGLSQRFSLRIAATLITIFWLVIGQALVRRLPITECGCFGQLLSLPPQRMWWIDLLLVMQAWWLVRRHTTSPSLDEWLT